MQQPATQPRQIRFLASDEQCAMGLKTAVMEMLSLTPLESPPPQWQPQYLHAFYVQVSVWVVHGEKPQDRALFFVNGSVYICILLIRSPFASFNTLYPSIFITEPPLLAILCNPAQFMLADLFQLQVTSLQWGVGQLANLIPWAYKVMFVPLWLLPKAHIGHKAPPNNSESPHFSL